MVSSASSGRFYFGGLLAPPAAPLPFPARKHASFLPGALEGAACLKPGDAAPRLSPAAARRLSALNLGILAARRRRRRLRSLPAPRPGHRRRRRRPPPLRPACSARAFPNGTQPVSAERNVPSEAPRSRSLFEIFRGALGGFPDSRGDSGRRARGARGAGEPEKRPGLAEARTEARTYSTSLSPPCFRLFDVRFRTCGGYWNRVGGFCS